MKGIVYDGFGPAEVLRLAEVPGPEVRPHDLLVRVKAAGVNRADILQRNGAYGNQSFGESTLLGLELAGEVVGVGSEVDDVSIGQRVMAIVGGGAYAEFARVDRRMSIGIPGNLTFVEGAAIMESFVTAVESVSHVAGVGQGQTVLGRVLINLRRCPVRPDTDRLCATAANLAMSQHRKSTAHLWVAATSSRSAFKLSQCPLSTSVLIGSTSAWMRSSMACTMPVASTAWSATRLRVPVSLASITS